MKNLSLFPSIFLAVAIALLANSLSTLWAKSDNKFSFLLVALVCVSPLVFISFGLVTAKVGLTITSGAVDSLLTVSTIAVGLIFFHEWNKISLFQYLGMLLALSGIFLMVFFPKISS